MTKPADWGVLGLGVMGENLALNLEDHGFSVAVANRNPDKAASFVQQNPGKRFYGATSTQDFLDALSKPRRILLMIKAGKPVDATLSALRPHLSPGDIVIDGGNSWFEETRRREEEYSSHGLNFFGMGVSGGEEGARFGPSLMPGGNRQAYEHVRPALEAIAAKTDSGACVTYVGPDGAGHCVKMVHNGIEYADMQLIAETYDILNRGIGLSSEEIAAVFQEWQEGPLNSFLIEITGKIFTVLDKDGTALVEKVLDQAAQKGTGMWTNQLALKLAVPVPTIAAAVDSRVLSSQRPARVRAAELIGSLSVSAPPPLPDRSRKERVSALHDALLAAKIVSYAQGLDLIQKASETHNWSVDLQEIARIWKGGCIIRARLLDRIMQAYAKDPSLPNLLLEPDFISTLGQSGSHWRTTICEAQRQGIPVPALASSLAYYDAYRSARLPQNLTQAQRDAFGAHTYQRLDDPEGEFLHSEWLN